MELTLENYKEQFELLWGISPPGTLKYDRMISILDFIDEVRGLQRQATIAEAERDYYHRLSMPVVNLDDASKNCKVCGYDHEHRNSFNESKYCMTVVAEKEREQEKHDEIIKANFVQVLKFIQGGPDHERMLQDAIEVYSQSPEERERELHENYAKYFPAPESKETL